jgi:hypothetical protein
VSNPWVVSFKAEDVGTRDTAYQDRIDRAHQLRAAGRLIQAIADELGVCAASVHAYLREAPRPQHG